MIRKPSNRRHRMLLFSALVIATVAGIAVFSSRGGAHKPPERDDPHTDIEPSASVAALGPDPKLSPRDVVRMQLSSLGSAGQGDEGIRQCFQFASPVNRGATGPIARFVTMVRSPPYDVMLHPAEILIGGAVVRGKRAVVLVSVVDQHERLHVFRFILSKQPEAPFEDCWMTDAVVDVGYQESPSVPDRSGDQTQNGMDV